MDIAEKLYKNEYTRTQELVRDTEWFLEFGKKRKSRLLGLGAVQAAFYGSIFQSADNAKKLTLDIFEDLLLKDEVRIGEPAKDELDDHDEDREEISQIVIHHSNHAEGISLSRLNALHLLRLYVPRYQQKEAPILDSKGEYQPIFSGHFDNEGKQVFYGYHWKVDQDGNAVRLLDDSALAWHAGNWDVNKRSIGICIDDNLSASMPTVASLDSVAAVIKEHYKNVPISEKSIIGHNEAFDTGCPGRQFLHGWKLELLERAAR